MLKAIFFDLGDTLIFSFPSKEELFRQAACEAGLDIGLKAIKIAYLIVNFQNKYSSIKIFDSKDKEDFYRKYNEELCKALGISTHFERIYNILKPKFKYQRKWKLEKGARWILENLYQQGVTLALIANWDKAISLLLEQLRIKKFFSLIISSQMIGVEKPNPEIFYYALDKLSFSAKDGRILYVGNEYEIDVLGSRKAGLEPILIDKDKIYLHADCARFDSLIKWYKSLKIFTSIIKNQE